MSRKLIVTIHELTPAHRAAIAAAAEKHGFNAEFYENNADAVAAAAKAEIIFGNAPKLAKIAPGLRWICTPSAGVNQFAGPDAFAAPDVLLSNSSGAYGVTIAEHIVMVTLELMRGAAALLEAEIPLSRSDYELLDMCGPGYALPSEEGARAVRLMAEKDGIFLDPVYTGKAFAGLLKLIETGRFAAGEDVLFVHTGGAGGLFAVE